MARHGLRAADIRAVPAAAGGPKGLILNPLDRFLFGHWLTGPGPSVHLAGASIGAWRLACACLPDADAALARLAEDYIAESYAPPTGERQSARNISARFAALLEAQLDGRQAELLARLSASGDATRQEGDLESKPVRVALPATSPIELILGQPD